MKMKNWILLVTAAVLLGACSGGGSTGDSKATSADQAAAESYKSKDAVPVDESLRDGAPNSPANNPSTGTGSSGIRSVPPSAPGDRS